jgi:hypothetical protein
MALDLAFTLRQAQGDAVKAQGDAFHCVMVSLTNHGADLAFTLRQAQGDALKLLRVTPSTASW